jgi:hypothetical protein
VLHHPTLATFVMLLSGMIVRRAHRTVCGMLAGAGLAGVWHHSRAHRFFAAARWDPGRLGLTVLWLIVGASGADWGATAGGGRRNLVLPPWPEGLGCALGL